MTKFELDNGFGTPHADTFTVRNISNYLRKGQINRKPVAIIGPPGVGKTHAIRRMAAVDHNIKIVTAGPTNRTPKTFLNDVAHVLGRYAGSGSAHDVFEIIKNDLYGDECKMIIIDEAQNPDLETLRLMLELFDETGVPIAFVGNPGVLRRTKVNRADFDQIDDRIALRLEIKGIHLEDIRVFGVHYNVEGMDAYSYLEKFGADKSIRKLCNILDEARQLAGSKGSIRLEHLRDTVAFHHSEDEERSIFKLIPKTGKKEHAA